MSDDEGEDAVRLVSSRKSDADTAVELRAEIMPILEQLAALMDRANAAGFGVHYGISPNPPYSLKNTVNQLHLVKYY